VKKRMRVDAEENKLLASVERGEWNCVGGGTRERARYARYARATLRKDRRLRIPVSSKGLEAMSAERITPRLLNMRQAAAYLGCSFRTARDYVLQGLIPVVDMPPLRAREGDRQRQTLRRVLIDRADLDAFIESRKRR
jgi:Helix-turn-helix domain